MENIKIQIGNCYGINRFEYSFDFIGNKSCHVIYAPNGVMKTSFANVFVDYMNNVESRDLVYTNRVSTRKLSDFSGNDIDRESLFVIRPYERSFKSEKMSTLLGRVC
ncbi:hypothetical protein J7E85_24445, partial [Paenibacillus sp. ISL-20]|nr:hypothetical protein [Paenibacillus sp. ISL-20]